ncbi:MAG: hypothetical protein R2751_12310 [Bacteroidales bacterium]
MHTRIPSFGHPSFRFTLFIPLIQDTIIEFLRQQIGRQCGISFNEIGILQLDEQLFPMVAQVGFILTDH